MRRGAVYWINLEPASPPEMGKVRPGVVVSNSDQNECLASVVVVPLSSKAPEIWPLRIQLAPTGMKPSYAVIPAIRQVSKSRLRAFIAQTPASSLKRIAEAISLYLND